MIIYLNWKNTVLSGFMSIAMLLWAQHIFASPENFQFMGCDSFVKSLRYEEVANNYNDEDHPAPDNYFSAAENTALNLNIAVA